MKRYQLFSNIAKTYYEAYVACGGKSDYQTWLEEDLPEKETGVNDTSDIVKEDREEAVKKYKKMLDEYKNELSDKNEEEKPPRKNGRLKWTKIVDEKDPETGSSVVGYELKSDDDDFCKKSKKCKYHKHNHEEDSRDCEEDEMSREEFVEKMLRLFDGLI